MRKRDAGVNVNGTGNGAMKRKGREGGVDALKSSRGTSGGGGIGGGSSSESTAAAISMSGPWRSSKSSRC